MAVDTPALLSAARWQDTAAYSPREFIAAFPLPQVARLAKGIPAAGSAVLPALNAAVFLISGGRKVKVAAQCVKLKDNRSKITPVGPKLAIPETYNGWFEILSEDGRAARVIDSVVELARRCPDSCVLRESIKAFVGKGDGTESLTDKAKILPAGETLVIVGEVVSSDRRFVTPATPSSTSQSSSTKGRFLRCFEPNGDSVFLSLDQKGRFSPVAREDSVSGVHNMRQLLRKRFPLMVRLVHGPPPVGAKNFLPEMRLYACFEEECLMALPLTAKENTPLVAVPLNAPIKFQGPSNADHVNGLPEHSRIADWCRQLLNEAQDKIQVFDIMHGKEYRTRRLPLIRRSVSDPSAKGGQPDRHENTGSAAPLTATPSTDDTCYDEIDQIYDYVRGFAPLPKAVRHELENADCPPPPPPIESIPVRRHSAPPQPARHLYEKLQRKVSTESSRNHVHPTSNNGPRFTKSVAQGRHPQRARLLLRHGPKVSIVPPKESPITVKGTNHSPLFNIRYKSLTNLATGDGSATVTSSNSAGSGGSAPREKRSRARLPRPRSLNNLLWDLQHKDVPAAPNPTKRLGTLYL